MSMTSAYRDKDVVHISCVCPFRDMFHCRSCNIICAKTQSISLYQRDFYKIKLSIRAKK